MRGSALLGPPAGERGLTCARRRPRAARRPRRRRRPPWWPPAPGWWLVLAAVVAIALVLAFDRASQARASPRDRRRVRRRACTRRHACRAGRRDVRTPAPRRAPQGSRSRSLRRRSLAAHPRRRRARGLVPRAGGRLSCWKARSVAKSTPRAVAASARARAPPLPGVDGAVNALRRAWSVAAFAWPYALLAIPLPLLARWLLPRRRSAAAALRVPYGAHIDKIAAAGGGHALRGRGAGLLAWLAWIAAVPRLRAPAATRRRRSRRRKSGAT